MMLNPYRHSQMHTIIISLYIINMYIRCIINSSWLNNLEIINQNYIQMWTILYINYDHISIWLYRYMHASINISSSISVFFFKLSTITQNSCQCHDMTCFRIFIAVHCNMVVTSDWSKVLSSLRSLFITSIFWSMIV